MKIVKLSKGRLSEAIALTLKCFLDSKPEDYDYPGKWLTYSLEHRKKGIDVGYWVVIENGKIIGISGIYNLPNDEKEANWLAWTCVDPRFRGKKIGSEIIDMMIGKTKKSGKKFMRLYTTSSDDQKVARILYEKRGFVETKREWDKEHKCYTIYLELEV